MACQQVPYTTNSQVQPVFDSYQRVLVTFTPRKDINEELKAISDLCTSKEVKYLCRLTPEGIVVALTDVE